MPTNLFLFPHGECCIGQVKLLLHLLSSPVIDGRKIKSDKFWQCYLTKKTQNKKKTFYWNDRVVEVMTYLYCWRFWWRENVSAGLKALCGFHCDGLCRVGRLYFMNTAIHWKKNKIVFIVTATEWHCMDSERKDPIPVHWLQVHESFLKLGVCAQLDIVSRLKLPLRVCLTFFQGGYEAVVVEACCSVCCECHQHCARVPSCAAKHRAKLSFSPADGLTRKHSVVSICMGTNAIRSNVCLLVLSSLLQWDWRTFHLFFVGTLANITWIKRAFFLGV